MKFSKGFTLIEILMVVALIGIIAAIAIPAYGDYVTRGKLVEASSQLSSLRVQIEQSFQDNRNYTSYVDVNCNLLPAATTSAIVGAKYFAYTCTTSHNPLVTPADIYTLTATGIDKKLTAFSYTIDQNNTKTSVTPWGNGATCWIMSKGSSC
jgi:type IV pilus assembly protein PilE